MKLTFLGATETVTGSKFLLEHRDTRILVDCGLFQGLKALRLRNRAPFAVAPERLDAVVLTHAHVDHSGYIPALYKAGFSGPVYCSPATRDLCRILLPDAGYLQEEEARFANAHGTSKHKPALPLYTAADGERCLQFFEPKEFHEPFSVGALQVRLSRAGHILGAASAHVSNGEREVLFSGDLGRPDDVVMRPPEPPGSPDYVVVESTYGDRAHPRRAAGDILEQIVRRVVETRGVLLIPAFAVGRAQSILHLLAELFHAGRTPQLPIYLNSPMAVSATKIFLAHAAEHRLTPEQCARLNEAVYFVQTVDKSKALNRLTGPAIIVSASGMATGGRVLHHLKSMLPDAKNTVLFAGYQAAGTRGEALSNGVDQVKIHGEYVPVRARIEHIDCLSAHADYHEIVAWLGNMAKEPRQTFIVHGEPAAQDAMRRHAKDFLGWDACVPSYQDCVELN